MGEVMKFSCWRAVGPKRLMNCEMKWSNSMERGEKTAPFNPPSIHSNSTNQFNFIDWCGMEWLIGEIDLASWGRWLIEWSCGLWAGGSSAAAEWNQSISSLQLISFLCLAFCFLFKEKTSPYRPNSFASLKKMEERVNQPTQLEWNWWNDRKGRPANHELSCVDEREGPPPKG